MDTAKDARVLVLEDAIRRLNELLGNRRFRFHVDYSKLGSALKAAGSLLYEVKYSYIGAEQLADLEATDRLVNAVLEFSEIFESALKSTGYRPETTNDRMAIIEARYAVGIAKDFQKKLKEFDDDPARAVNIIAVEITKTTPIEGSKSLTECRCTDGERIWTIATNIQGVKINSKLAAAILPPAELMGIVSEAMFLGGNELPEDTSLGSLEHPPKSSLDQARAQVLQITQRMMK